jgi:hypothetical protein
LSCYAPVRVHEDPCGSAMILHLGTSAMEPKSFSAGPEQSEKRCVVSPRHARRRGRLQICLIGGQPVRASARHAPRAQ